MILAWERFFNIVDRTLICSSGADVSGAKLTGTCCFAPRRIMKSFSRYKNEKSSINIERIHVRSFISRNEPRDLYG